MTEKKFKKVVLNFKWLECFDTNDNFLHGDNDEIRIYADCSDDGSSKRIWSHGGISKGDRVTIDKEKSLKFKDSTMWTIRLIESDPDGWGPFDTGSVDEGDEIGRFTLSNSTAFNIEDIRKKANEDALSGSAWMDGSGAAYRLTWDAEVTYSDDE